MATGILITRNSVIKIFRESLQDRKEELKQRRGTTVHNNTNSCSAAATTQKGVVTTQDTAYSLSISAQSTFKFRDSTEVVVDSWHVLFLCLGTHSSQEADVPGQAMVYMRVYHGLACTE